MDAMKLRGEREGVVLLLCGITYTKETGNGIRTIGLPATVQAGEIVDLSEIPDRQKQHLQEGVDFLREWSKTDQASVQREVNQLNDQIMFGNFATYDC
jgi:hypothetical protein